MKKQTLLYSILILLFSCNNGIKEKPKSDAIFPKDTTRKTDSIIQKKKINPADIKPIFGYRFQVTGDFDGDGVKEILNEHFYSKRDHKETNKYFSGIDDAWILYDSVHKRDCISYMLCSKFKLDTIPIWGILGPIFVKNEGDLDNDGGDEISYVPSLEQQSSINHCHILSFKKGKWKELYSFEIREWQIPPLPQAGKTYGLFGMEGVYDVGDNDTINKEVEKQFNNFAGFIKKLKSGKIKVQTFTHIADDTTLIVDLKKHPKPYN